MSLKLEQLSSCQTNDGAASSEAAHVDSTERYPITTVRINSLAFEGSPRLSGKNAEHTRLLAETDGELPPITVHRQTMRVIDGMHRAQAAHLNGRDIIAARLVGCDEDMAFVLAVKANVTHGLPLSRTDRKAAAARLIASYPHWSDRAVAASTGLSDKTVSRIRACSTSETSQSNARLGADGRRRPISADPRVGLREVARATGMSPATVRDVRRRIDRTEDVVPRRYRSTEQEVKPADVTQMVTKRLSRMRGLDGLADPHAVLSKLKDDPSLKFNEAGRHILRWLHQHVMHPESWQSQGLDVLDHCAPTVATLARTCAVAWMMLAEQLERRVDASNPSLSRKTE